MRSIKLQADHLRLLASLGFNFAAKLPGIAAVFIILPLVSQSLGSAAYGEWLSALALGTVFTLPFGGINAVGRRLLAGAFGAKDKKKQADIFATTLLFMLLAAGVAILAMAAVSAHSWSRSLFLLIAAFPIIGGLCNCFDNLRASYNEHYVTAGFQLFFQVTIYAAVYFIGLPQGDVLVAAVALQMPYMLASIGTLIALLYVRPYLMRGHVKGMRAMIMPAVGVMLADGALASLLNLSVYWLNFTGDANMAAWVGTFVRLFQSFMSPVLLILFPLTSYLSGRWAHLSARRRVLLHKLFIAAGLGYGVIVGAAMAFGGPLYISHMFKLAAHGDKRDVLALSLFMGAVVAQKAYTLLLYAVAEAQFVSYGTAIVAALGVAAAAIASAFLPAIRALDVLFVSIGVMLPILLMIGDYRHRRAHKMSEVPMEVIES